MGASNLRTIACEMQYRSLTNSDLISYASQYFGAYIACPSERSKKDYNLCVDEILTRISDGADFSTDAKYHARTLEKHANNKYKDNDSFAAKRDMHAVKWLKSFGHSPLSHIGHSISHPFTSEEMGDIFSRGVPNTKEEWLNACCLTKNINIRDLIRIKFGPEYFEEGYIENFQMPYDSKSEEAVKDITNLFPELKKYCLEYQDEQDSIEQL